MPASFDIAVKPARSLILITCQGFFTLDDVRRMEAACRAAYAELPYPDARLALVDMSGMQIQSQEVVAAFAAMVRHPALRAGRAAYIVGASLARGQTRRLHTPGCDALGYFDDRPSAEAWLLAEPVSDARTASRYRHAPASPTSGARDCTARSAA